MNQKFTSVEQKFEAEKSIPNHWTTIDRICNSANMHDGNFPIFYFGQEISVNRNFNLGSKILRAVIYKFVFVRERILPLELFQDKSKKFKYLIPRF